MLPIMRAGAGSASPGVALFTSVSATCVTGLAVVDTGTYWSAAGQVTILVAHPDRRLRDPGAGHPVDPAAQPQARDRLPAGGPGRDRRAHPGRRPSGARAPLPSSPLTVESTVALLLGARFWLYYDAVLGEAAWRGIFHSISAFNNAGFALASDSLISYGQDPLILGPIALAIMLGGLGSWSSSSSSAAHRGAQAGAATPATTMTHDEVSPVAASWRGARATGWAPSTPSGSASPTRSRCRCTPA